MSSAKNYETMAAPDPGYRRPDSEKGAEAEEGAGGKDFDGILPGQMAEDSPVNSTGEKKKKQKKSEKKPGENESAAVPQGGPAVGQPVVVEVAQKDEGAVVTRDPRQVIPQKVLIPVDREALLDGLVQLDNLDAQWILELWASKRRDLKCFSGFQEFTRQELMSSARKTGSDVAYEYSEVTNGLDAPKTAMVETPASATILQFTSFMYFCDESDGHMAVDVMRIGDLTSQTKVQYTTRDGTAIAGTTYEATSGTLVFEPGENEKQIEVPVIKSEDWNTTLEFGLELKEEGIVNGTLGRYLWQTRVKVINPFAFPSNRYKDNIVSQNLDSVSKRGLFWEYFKFNWGNAVIRRGTIKMMCVDLLHNLYFLLKLFMKVWLVDYILKGEEFHGHNFDQESSLILYIIMMVGPFALLHILDMRKFSWKVGGTSRGRLQNALLEKFLNYDDDSRVGLNQGDLVLAMTRHSVELVHDGYMQVLSLAKCVGQLVMVLVFQVSSPYIVGDGEQHAEKYIPLLVYPVLQLTFLMLRDGVTRDVVQSEQQCQDSLVEHIDQTVSNYSLIAEFNQRPYFTSQFSKKIKSYNASLTAAGKVAKNNGIFAEWITVVYVAVYTFKGGLEYIDGGLTLGMLLTNITILGTIGKSTGQIYATLLVLQRNVPSLERVVTYMNLTTDVSHRKTLNRARRAMTKKLREEEKENCTDGIPCDNLPILIRDFKFAYNMRTKNPTNNQSGPRKSQSNPFSPRIEEMRMSQGSFILMVGPPREWKSTILKVLGGAVLPKIEREDQLTFFVPSHLRVLHVSNTPMYFAGTLKANLLFGVSPDDPDGSDERIKKICMELGLPEHVLQLLETDEVHDWDEMLSQTECQILSLARALIANPEVLCIHKPAMVFHEDASKHIFQLLRDFVDQKGIYQDTSTKHLRRPRTCIVTCQNAMNKVLAGQLADKAFHVSNAGVRILSKAQITTLTQSEAVMTV